MNRGHRINETNQINQIDRTDQCSLWYVIQTKPADEVRVERNLTNQGLEVFLPLFESHQYGNGRGIVKVKPLFPNYLFGRFDIDLHYYQVKWTRGVTKILGFGNGPVPISDKVIEKIKKRMGVGNLIKMEEEVFQEGDPIQIISGPFKELRGIFQRNMSDKRRVKILMDLIGVEVPVQIPRWQIKKDA